MVHRKSRTEHELNEMIEVSFIHSMKWPEGCMNVQTFLPPPLCLTTCQSACSKNTPLSITVCKWNPLQSILISPLTDSDPHSAGNIWVDSPGGERWPRIASRHTRTAKNPNSHTRKKKKKKTPQSSESEIVPDSLSVILGCAFSVAATSSIWITLLSETMTLLWITEDYQSIHPQRGRQASRDNLSLTHTHSFYLLLSLLCFCLSSLLSAPWKRKNVLSAHLNIIIQLNRHHKVILKN